MLTYVCESPYINVRGIVINLSLKPMSKTVPKKFCQQFQGAFVVLFQYKQEVDDKLTVCVLNLQFVYEKIEKRKELFSKIATSQTFS